MDCALAGLQHAAEGASSTGQVSTPFGETVGSSATSAPGRGGVFTASGADEQTIERAANDLYSGTGVIVVGERFYPYSGRGKGRRANQFWTKAPVPLH